jgi:hypothetical protein
VVVFSASAGEKLTSTIVELPRPNSGTFSFAQAEARRSEILSNAPSRTLENWKNPYMGFCIHIAKDDSITVYNHWLKTLPDYSQPRPNQSVVQIKQLIAELPLEGNPAGVLVTSDAPLKDSKPISEILKILFVPSVQLFHVKRSEPEPPVQPIDKSDIIGADSGRRPAQPSSSKKNPADAGRDLRMMMLTASPEKMGEKPTKEFPRVYGVLMDWSIGEQTATVFSASTGAASLYTTSTFGIIGGEGHESVRTAAMSFVRASDRFFEGSTPAAEYPYPTADRVRFYLLTFEGVRVIDTDLESITNRSSKYAELFGLGQAVLTELRLITEKRQ